MVSSLIRVRPIAAAIACLALASCDLAGAPERFFDEAARAPVVAPLDLADLRPGQHLAGTVRFTLNLDSLSGRVERVVLFLNEAYADERQGPPFTFDLLTDNWEQGPLNLSLGIYTRDARQGLLSGLPSHLLGPFRVVVDRSPSTPVEITGITWEGDRPRVTWTRNEDPNFHAYVVLRLRRGDRDMSPSSFYSGEEVATITDRNATTFLDTPAPPEYGASTRYAVVVSNRTGTPTPDRWAATQYGEYVEVPSLAASVAHPTRPEVYGIGGIGFRALSLGTRTLIHTIAQEGWESRFDAPALSPSGALLLLPRTPVFPSTQQTVSRVDPASFQILGEFAVDQEFGPFAVSDAGRAFSFRSTWRDVFLGAIDTGTGAVLAEVGGFIPQTRPFHLSPDGQTMTAFSPGQQSGARLYRVDVSGEAPRVTGERAFETYQGASAGSSGRLYTWRLSNGPFYLVEVLDGITLRTERTLDMRPAGGDWVIGVKEGAGSVFVWSTAPDGQGGAPPTQLTRHRLSDLAVTQTWRFRAVVTDYFVTPDGERLVVLTTRDESGGDVLQLWTLPLQP